MERAQKPYVVVVGVDYSETGLLAFQQAFELAASHAVSELHVINVVHVVLPSDEFGLTPLLAHASMTFPEAEEELAEYVRQKVAEFSQKLGANRNTPPRVIPHVRLEAPAQEIAQLAVDLEADVVVVGTHGRRALARVVLGSVAEVVVRLAPCPVFVVRPQRLVELPRIEPPCPECVKARKESRGESQWCPQHSERHGQRHTYHQNDRLAADGTMPLVFRS
jgi:nucleotide-binding universal stress UspA family protein